MKKIAIFVEGQTEMLFIQKLCSEIAGRGNIVFRMEQAQKNRNFTLIEAVSAITDEPYFILIKDSNGGAHGTVKSDIIDQAERLEKNGYERIIGIWDLFPEPYSNLNNHLIGLYYRVPTGYMPIRMIIAVMETETWFITESNHFKKIDAGLTNSIVRTTVGYDPVTVKAETIETPADDMDKIYRTVGKRYTKRKKNAERTIKLLDYSEIYVNLRTRIKALDLLLSELDLFFS